MILAGTDELGYLVEKLPGNRGLGVGAAAEDRHPTAA